MAAVPLTSPKVLYGRVVAVGTRLPVWAVATGDAALASVIQAVQRARELGATVVAGGDAAATVPGMSCACRRRRRP